MVHTANFAGIGKGRRPQATCQREECEPFGVIPNYVINYLIVLIFIKIESRFHWLLHFSGA